MGEVGDRLRGHVVLTADHSEAFDSDRRAHHGYVARHRLKHLVTRPPPSVIGATATVAPTNAGALSGTAPVTVVPGG